jgi:hypothetical protein
MDRKKRSEAKVEIAGVEVSQSLIDSAVRATSDPEMIKEVEERERARTRKIISDSELRADIDVSKQITSALIEQAAKPESQRVSIEDLPPGLKRVVLAHVNLMEAQEEYDVAVMQLQKPVNTERAS